MKAIKTFAANVGMFIFEFILDNALWILIVIAMVYAIIDLNKIKDSGMLIPGYGFWR